MEIKLKKIGSFLLLFFVITALYVSVLFFLMFVIIYIDFPDYFYFNYGWFFVQNLDIDFIIANLGAFIVVVVLYITIELKRKKL